MHARARSGGTKIVASFDELVSSHFGDGVNALCWRRDLAGNFREVADGLRAGEGVTPIDDDELLALSLSSAGVAARDVLLADQTLLRERGLSPSLDLIQGYRRDEADGPVATDVYSFHVDRATVEADTYLCTYCGRSSEGLANDAAIRRVDDAATRAELLRVYGGPDDAAFTAYLAEQCYDLHYAPLPRAEPFEFGCGNLWRIAIAWPGSVALPCIHRAPLMRRGDPARLLLIS